MGLNFAAKQTVIMGFNLLDQLHFLLNYFKELLVSCQNEIKLLLVLKFQSHNHSWTSRYLLDVCSVSS